MGSSLTGGGLVLLAGAVHFVVAGEGVVGGRPTVALFFDLPGLGLTFFEAHVASGVGGAAEADLVPGPGVGVVDGGAVADEDAPEAFDVHLFPEVEGGGGFAFVDRLEDRFLLGDAEGMEGLCVELGGHGFEGTGGEAVGLPVGGHVFEAIAADAVDGEAVIDAGEDGDLAGRGAVFLGEDAIDDGEHGEGFFGGEEADGLGWAEAIEHDGAGGGVPVGFLAEGAEAWVVAGLIARGEIVAGGWVGGEISLGTHVFY